MRKKIYIPALLTLAFLLSALIWLKHTHRTDNEKSSFESEHDPNSAPAALNVSQGSNVTIPSQKAATATQNPVINSRSPEAIRQYVESQNVPVEFYGKVVDQDESPLSGVKVKVKVRHWTVIVPAPFGASGGMIPIQRESDGNGRFEIRGATGDGLDIESCEKEGYEFEMTQRSYSATGGSLAEPVIFRMWNTNIHENLITGNKSFQIVPDGRSYVIDLTNGTLSETGEGNLKIWVKRPGQITPGKKYDWSCEMTVINGGLSASTNGSSAYLAPPEGYIPSFQFEQQVGSGWGDSTGEKHFYVRINNGKAYGRIAVELFAYYNSRSPGLVRIKYALNPSGSRVLR